MAEDTTKTKYYGMKPLLKERMTWEGGRECFKKEMSTDSKDNNRNLMFLWNQAICLGRKRETKVVYSLVDQVQWADVLSSATLGRLQIQCVIGNGIEYYPECVSCFLQYFYYREWRCWSSIYQLTNQNQITAISHTEWDTYLLCEEY